MRSWGERISFLREAKGMTQEELAVKLGISRSSLSHYEKNRRKPDYVIISAMADIFHVSIDYLLGRVSDSLFSYSPDKPDRSGNTGSGQARR